MTINEEELDSTLRINDSKKSALWLVLSPEILFENSFATVEKKAYEQATNVRKSNTEETKHDRSHFSLLQL